MGHIIFLVVFQPMVIPCKGPFDQPPRVKSIQESFNMVVSSSLSWPFGLDSEAIWMGRICHQSYDSVAQSRPFDKMHLVSPFCSSFSHGPKGFWASEMSDFSVGSKARRENSEFAHALATRQRLATGQNFDPVLMALFFHLLTWFKKGIHHWTHIHVVRET